MAVQVPESVQKSIEATKSNMSGLAKVDLKSPFLSWEP